MVNVEMYTREYSAEYDSPEFRSPLQDIKDITGETDTAPGETEDTV